MQIQNIVEPNSNADIIIWVKSVRSHRKSFGKQTVHIYSPPVFFIFKRKDCKTCRKQKYTDSCTVPNFIYMHMWQWNSTLLLGQSLHSPWIFKSSNNPWSYHKFNIISRHGSYQKWIDQKCLLGMGKFSRKKTCSFKYIIC